MTVLRILADLAPYLGGLALMFGGAAFVAALIAERKRRRDDAARRERNGWE